MDGAGNTAKHDDSDVCSESEHAAGEALDKPLTYDDPALAEIVDAWPTLPDPVRAGIRAMVGAVARSD